MAKEVKLINRRKKERQTLDPEGTAKIISEIKEHEENVQEYQLQLELVENDMEQLRAKCPSIEDIFFDDDAKNKLSRGKEPALKMIAKLDGPVLRSLLWNFLESYVGSEVRVALCFFQLKVMCCFTTPVHTSNFQCIFRSTVPTTKPERYSSQKGVYVAKL
jgi:hypothetical protein